MTKKGKVSKDTLTEMISDVRKTKAKPHSKMSSRKESAKRIIKKAEDQGLFFNKGGRATHGYGKAFMKGGRAK